jgi:Mce-associated membrane protein
MESASQPPRQATRRRASRPAGPVDGAVTSTSVKTSLKMDGSAAAGIPPERQVRPPTRRPAHNRLVAIVALVVGLTATAAMAAVFSVLLVQEKNAAAYQARQQQFVDTASQTVVNMFSFTPDTIDASVNRFLDGTSGPLRDMLSSDNNVDNLKAMFRDTNASSEAVINGAALESVDEIGDKASVLVSVRVTVTDIDGINKPSEPYRMRVIVHQDDNGRMTGYDLKYPDGGN